MYGSGKPTSTQLTLLAGYKYKSLQITSSNDYSYDGPLHENGVLSMRGNIFTRDECALTTNYVPMAVTENQQAALVPSVLATGQTLSVFNLGPQLTARAEFPHLVFMNGGRYRLCYAPDGTFDLRVGAADNNLVAVPISVTGVMSGCKGDGCLRESRWDCYFTYRAEESGPCVVDFRDFGERKGEGWAARTGIASRLWWTQAWGDDVYTTTATSILYQPAAPRECSTTLDSGTFIQPETTRFDPTFQVGNALGAGLLADGNTAATLPPLWWQAATSSFTLTLCYCPSFDSTVDAGTVPCDDKSEFIQPIGRALYWTLRICDLSNYLSCGTVGQPYMRVLPQQPFTLRVQCPPGGRCAGDNTNKVKFIYHIAGAEDFPMWHRSHRCKLFPREPDVAEVNWVLRPGEKLADLNLNGGSRRDYKVWFARPLITNLSMNAEFDVCYCDSQCDDGYTGFFKVGTIRTAESMGVARWTQNLADKNKAVDPIETVQYVGKVGAITMYAGTTSPLSEGMQPYDSVPFSRPALMKLLPFDGETLKWRALLFNDTASPAMTLEDAIADAPEDMLDLTCSVGSYRPTLIDGPSTPDLAKDWTAYVPKTSRYLPFTGSSNDQSFTVLKAGILVVCYCATLDVGGGCADSRYWISVAKIMVRGPVSGVSLRFPTNFVIGVSLQGWGFTATDTLRFITPTQSCSENSFTPKAVTSGYRLACPGVNGTGCRLPTLTENIKAIVESAYTSNVFIRGIDVGSNLTTLRFTGDITSFLSDGDAITIEEDTLLYNGKVSSNWTASERYQVAKLTGMYEFADDALARRMLWNKVSYIVQGGAPARDQLTLQVGWPADALPAFLPRNQTVGIAWTRRNKMRTNTELKAPNPLTMKVCWAARDEGVQKYYADVGSISFSDPLRMYDAGVFLTTRREGAVAPLVITFTPSRAQQAYRRLTVPVVVRLSFRDLEHKLEPLLAGQLDEELGSLGGDDQVPLSQASQALCGKLFLEMWTNDVGEFPLPRGCYYGPLYKDQPTVFPDGSVEVVPSYREYYIAFEPQAGLKNVCVDSRTGRTGVCVYMFVLNARLGSVTTLTDEMVGVYTQCEGAAEVCAGYTDMPPVIEYGKGVLGRPTLAGAGPNSAQVARVEFATAGSGLDRYVPSVDPLEMTGARIDEATQNELQDFEIRAWPVQARRPIQRMATLRLWLTPFSAWDLGISSACDAECRPPPGVGCNDGRGGNRSTCSVTEVTDGPVAAFLSMPKNVLTLVYPAEMESIPAARANETHLLAVRGLALPQQGFFPRRWLAQLTDGTDASPSIVLASPTVFRVPTAGMTSGKILIEGQTGSGPRPFNMDKNNQLIVRLTLGATLRNTAADGATVPARLQLTLPEGYGCFINGIGAARTPGAQELFARDDNGDGFFDNYNQTLRNGDWTTSGRFCTFTLQPFAQIFAGQVFYVQLNVNNPLGSLMRDDPANVWLVSFNGTNMTPLGKPIQFLALADEASDLGWAGNYAVLTPLGGQLLQPSRMEVGAPNWLSVFFTAQHSMPTGSYIVLDAPDDFDFATICTVADLDPEYYEDWEGLRWGEDLVGDRARTYDIGIGPNCSGDNWKRLPRSPPATANFTRARIRVPRTLITGRVYGFAIRVRNARTYSVDQHNSWRLWVYSPEGYPVDGSRDTLVFSAPRSKLSLSDNLYDRSWGVYAAPLRSPQLTADFGAPAVLPSQSSLISAVLTVFPLEVASDGGLVDLRFMAPVGYAFQLGTADGFRGSVPNRTCLPDCVLITPAQVFNGNELVLPSLVLRVGKRYGFQVRVTVPSRAPTRSTDAFFLELGFKSQRLTWNGNSCPRLQGGLLPAPILRTLHDAEVYTLSNAAAATGNIVEFQFITASPMGPRDGFVFQGDAYTKLTVLRCSPTAVPGTLPLPDDLECKITVTSDGLPLVVLSIVQSTIPAGRYGLRFQGVVNPPNPLAQAGSWLLGTFSNAKNFPLAQVLDQAVQIPSARVGKQLRRAGFLSPPDWDANVLGRDDRPGAANLLTLYFALGSRLTTAPSVAEVVLSIRGPMGFSFAENCTGDFRVLGNLSGSVNATWPCSNTSRASQSWCPLTIQAWPWKLVPTACLGLGNTARISVPNFYAMDPYPPGCGRPTLPCRFDGFEVDVPYGFQIRTTNPPDNNTTKSWAFDLDSHASLPLPSITVRTFAVNATLLQVTSAVKAAFGDTVNTPSALRPVSLLLTPASVVPGPRSPDSSRRLQNVQTISQLPLGPLATQGQLVLQAPAGFLLSCQQLIFERAGRAASDLVSIFQVGTDVLCSVLSNKLTLVLVGSKQLDAGVTYRLVVFVLNPKDLQPALPWDLSSSKTRVATGVRIPLDHITLPGFPVINRIPVLAIANPTNETGGGMRARSVRITIQFNLPLYDGDRLTLSAPAGYDLRGTPVVGGPASPCADFKWKAGTFPLVWSPPPSCTCETRFDGLMHCAFRLTVNEGKASATPPRTVVWSGGVDFAFELSVLNPASAPDPVENYWRLEQSVAATGEVTAGQLTVSWPVYAQVSNITVSVSGIQQRAGATSDITLWFTPAAWGNMLEINFREPAGFAFDTCRPMAPLARDSHTLGPRLVLSGGSFEAGQPSQVSVAAARLGAAGQTRIDLRLYSSQSLDPSTEVARRMSFLGGFRMPGALTVLAQYFWSAAVVAHYELNKLDPVLPALPPHAGEFARVELIFNITAPALNGSWLVLASVKRLGADDILPCAPTVDEPGLSPSVAVCNSSGPINGSHEVGDSRYSTCSTTGEVNVSSAEVLRSADNLVYGLNLTLTSSLPGPVLAVGGIYRLRAWCRATLDSSVWRLEAQDGQPGPTNTNDALNQAAPAALNLQFSVTPFTSRSPPGALVRVAVRVSTGGSQRTVQFPVQVMLPIGFVLFQNGLPVGGRDSGGGRAVVSVADSYGTGDINSVAGRRFNLEVLTPGSTPSDRRWFVLAMATDGSISGWGEDDGFELVSLPLRLVYAPIPIFTGWVATSFTIPSVAGAFNALVTAPKGFELKCPGDNPGDPPLLCHPFTNSRGEVPGAGVLERTVNVSLTAVGTPEGTNIIYSFLLMVMTPDQARNSQIWDVRIIDINFNLVDAAIGFIAPTSGTQWRGDYFMESPSLSWQTAPQSGETSIATVEVTLTRRIQNVRALLIYLPENYRHDIQNANQVKSLNREFPIALDTDWRVFWNLRWIRILTEDALEDSLDLIPAGVFQFQFPVMVPTTMPAQTEWYLAMCVNQRCDNPDSSDVSAAFPIPNTAPVLAAQTFGVGRVALTAGAWGPSRSRLGPLARLLPLLLAAPLVWERR